jgi:RHS repeat-associated protein
MFSGRRSRGFRLTLILAGIAGSVGAAPALAQSGPANDTVSALASDRYYDHARYHVGGLARFLSPDVVRGNVEQPGSWNRYVYSQNNPLRNVDPDGRQSCDLVSRDPNVMYLTGQISIQELRARPAEVAPLGAAVVVGGLAFFAPEMAVAVAARGMPVLSPFAGRIASFFDRQQILLGETMKDRVEAVASSTGARNFGTESKHVAQMLAEDVRWLQTQIDKGVRIFDISINPARVGGRSPFYGAEVSVLARNGMKRVFSHLVTVGEKVYKVYEWVAKTPPAGD